MSTEQEGSFSLPIDVVFRDIDVMGHVNNAVYFTYMETARTNFFMKHLDLDDPSDLPFILAQISCTYRSAAQFGEQLNVKIFVSRIGRKSFDISYAITTNSGRMVAEGLSVMVTFDYSKRCTIPIPDDIMELLVRYFSSDSVA